MVCPLFGSSMDVRYCTRASVERPSPGFSVTLRLSHLITFSNPSTRPISKHSGQHILTLLAQAVDFELLFLFKPFLGIALCEALSIMK